MDRLISKYPDKAPIVLTDYHTKEQTKLLISKNITFGSFIISFRRSKKLNSHEGYLFLTDNGDPLSHGYQISTLYEKYSKDGLLKITYRKEAIFG